MKLSIVIPCHNERPTIEAIVDSIRAGLPELPEKKKAAPQMGGGGGYDDFD